MSSVFTKLNKLFDCSAFWILLGALAISLFAICLHHSGEDFEWETFKAPAETIAVLGTLVLAYCVLYGRKL